MVSAWVQTMGTRSFARLCLPILREFRVKEFSTRPFSPIHRLSSAAAVQIVDSS